MAAGYSVTTLAKKLGIKKGFRIRIINALEHYFQLFSDFPEDVHISNGKTGHKQFIHFFSKDLKVLNTQLPILKDELEQVSMIWVS
ncbi:MAG: hypothetical protein WCG87_10735 [Bacteroidota bacterium]